MDLMELQNSIKWKDTKNFYIFVGDELGILNKYISFIAELQELPIKRVETYKEIEEELKRVSLLNIQYLYVIYNDKKILSDTDFINKIKKKSINGTIILRYDNIDNRKQLFKEFVDETIVFSKLHKDVLISYIDSYIKISKSNALRLIEYCGKDYNRLISECEKLFLLQNIYDININEIIENLFDNNFIFDISDNLIFSIVRNLLLNKPSGIIELEKIDNYLLLISLLLDNLFNILKYKSEVSSGNYNKFDIIKRTGLNSFQFDDCYLYDKIYSVKEILYLIDKIRKYELRIKLGQVDAYDAIYSIISYLY